MKHLQMGILLFLGLWLFPLMGNAEFQDVPSNHMYKDSIDYVASQGIMNGTNGNFSPNVSMNRAELIKIAVSARYEADVIDDCIQSYKNRNYYYVYFTDVPTASWYGPYVCVAQQNGIVNGYPDRTLRPDQKVSFVEAAKILLGTLGIQGSGSDQPWYKPYVTELEARSAIPMTIQNFESALTRSEFAEITSRLLQNIDFKTSKKYQDLAPSVNGPCDNCLVIDKLDIQVPIVLGVGVAELSARNWAALESKLLAALRDGVVHYPGTAKPGEMGNVFLTGHSSYYRNDPGAYKDVFARLPDLAIGDTYTIFYGGKKYAYEIFDSKIISPEEVQVLDQNTVDELSTLMTCWPRYTNQQRKILTAKRIE